MISYMVAQKRGNKDKRGRGSKVAIRDFFHEWTDGHSWVVYGADNKKVHAREIDLAEIADVEAASKKGRSCAFMLLSSPALWRDAADASFKAGAMLEAMSWYALIPAGTRQIIVTYIPTWDANGAYDADMRAGIDRMASLIQEGSAYLLYAPTSTAWYMRSIERRLRDAEDEKSADCESNACDDKIASRTNACDNKSASRISACDELNGNVTDASERPRSELALPLFVERDFEMFHGSMVTHGAGGLWHRVRMPSACFAVPNVSSGNISLEGVDEMRREAFSRKCALAASSELIDFMQDVLYAAYWYVIEREQAAAEEEERECRAYADGIYGSDGFSDGFDGAARADRSESDALAKAKGFFGKRMRSFCETFGGGCICPSDDLVDLVSSAIAPHLAGVRRDIEEVDVYEGFLRANRDILGISDEAARLMEEAEDVMERIRGAFEVWASIAIPVVSFEGFRSASALSNMLWRTISSEGHANGKDLAALGSMVGIEPYLAARIERGIPIEDLAAGSAGETVRLLRSENDGRVRA